YAIHIDTVSRQGGRADGKKMRVQIHGTGAPICTNGSWDWTVSATTRKTGTKSSSSHPDGMVRRKEGQAGLKQPYRVSETHNRRVDRKIGGSLAAASRSTVKSGAKSSAAGDIRQTHRHRRQKPRKIVADTAPIVKRRQKSSRQVPTARNYYP